MAQSAVPAQPLFVSPLEAAYLLGLSRQRVYELLDDGLIESRRSGSRRLVLLSSVYEYADLAVG
jgi:excisionase family DNA binding protein